MSCCMLSQAFACWRCVFCRQPGVTVVRPLQFMEVKKKNCTSTSQNTLRKQDNGWKNAAEQRWISLLWLCYVTGGPRQWNAMLIDQRRTIGGRISFCNRHLLMEFLCIKHWNVDRSVTWTHQVGFGGTVACVVFKWAPGRVGEQQRNIHHHASTWTKRYIS